MKPPFFAILLLAGASLALAQAPLSVPSAQTATPQFTEDEQRWLKLLLFEQAANEKAKNDFQSELGSFSATVEKNHPGYRLGQAGGSPALVPIAPPSASPTPAAKK